MKKILVLSHSTSIGGGELALKSLIDSTDDEYKWTIAFPSESEPDPAIIPNTATVVSVDNLKWWCHEAHERPRLIDKTTFKSSYARLAQLAKDHDILVTNTLTIPWLGFIAQQIGKPHIWYVHEFGDIDHNLQFIAGYENSLRLIDDCSSRVLTISEAVRSHIGKVIPVNKIDLIHQSVDVRELTKIPVIDSSEPLSKYLSMGAIKPSKGQKVAIDALKLVPGTLDVVGPAADQTYAEQIIVEALEAPNVSIEVRRYDPIKELLDHQVVLMCSDNEGLGRVTLEALAAGRIVVGYDCPSTHELLKDGRGILYSPNTPQALAAILGELPALSKEIDTNKARSYVLDTFSDKGQASDFANCLMAAEAQPLTPRGSAYDEYVSIIDTNGIWENGTHTIKRHLRRLLPPLLKRLLRRLVGLFKG